MADISGRRSESFAGHPDVLEMRERYARLLSGRGAVAIDVLVLLAGLYLAISPWVVHFTGTHPNLTVNNLILGITVALLGLGLAMAPERMYGLSWAVAAIGAWMIIAPWVADRFPDRGTVLSNVIAGGITCLLGLLAAGMLFRKGRRRRE